MCFAWVSEQRGIISLYTINWLVFITEKVSVYCAVRAEYIIFKLEFHKCSILILIYTFLLSEKRSKKATLSLKSGA